MVPVATLLLLRHGRTTANADGGLAGRQPVELDETGRAQAAAVGERLRSVPLAAVVTSPLIRCRQTLELALPDADPLVEEGLIECGYGAWEGQPLKKLAKEPLWPVVQQHPSAVVFPQGEAMAAMAARAVAAVRAWDARIASEHGPEAVWLACSHGDVIKAIVADALGVHLDLFQRIVADPASVTAIRYTTLRPFLLRLNDTGGDLAALAPPPRKRRRAARAATSAADSDAPVGGGAGAGR
ncbi:MSMEG_4193 family putative phosphomutase [Micromonospora sp. M61]|uniref:MSMEG_4193 family putative phosphomutase n=1 Tax=Micromonospora sp. M61 TaxID=2824890 RepID=UPI001B382F38|nr:MSMEG_4193 family putative phosphomutase [Micromonospora sp. M61]MBQ0981314.1 MSMEG_4193 family putative phosphomutase [Micromonospora sp. M61]